MLGFDSRHPLHSRTADFQRNQPFLHSHGVRLNRKGHEPNVSHHPSIARTAGERRAAPRFVRSRVAGVGGSVVRCPVCAGARQNRAVSVARRRRVRWDTTQAQWFRRAVPLLCGRAS